MAFFDLKCRVDLNVWNIQIFSGFSGNFNLLDWVVKQKRDEVKNKRIWIKKNIYIYIYKYIYIYIDYSYILFVHYLLYKMYNLLLIRINSWNIDNYDLIKSSNDY